LRKKRKEEEKNRRRGEEEKKDREEKPVATPEGKAGEGPRKQSKKKGKSSRKENRYLGMGKRCGKNNIICKEWNGQEDPTGNGAIYGRRPPTQQGDRKIAFGEKTCNYSLPQGRMARNDNKPGSKANAKEDRKKNPKEGGKLHSLEQKLSQGGVKIPIGWKKRGKNLLEEKRGKLRGEPSISPTGENEADGLRNRLLLYWGERPVAKKGKSFRRKKKKVSEKRGGSLYPTQQQKKKEKKGHSSQRG